MLKSKKLTIVIPGVILALGLIGTSIFTTDIASAVTNNKLLHSLQEQFKTEEAKLEKMPNKTKEEMDKTIEQGMKIKEVGKQAGELRKEVDPLAVVEEKLDAAEAAISDPIMFETSDPRYEKAIKLQEKNKSRLKNVRANLEVKKKQQSNGEQVSLDDITKELVDIQNTLLE